MKTRKITVFVILSFLNKDYCGFWAVLSVLSVSVSVCPWSVCRCVCCHDRCVGVSMIGVSVCRCVWVPVYPCVRVSGPVYPCVRVSVCQWSVTVCQWSVTVLTVPVTVLTDFHDFRWLLTDFHDFRWLLMILGVHTDPEVCHGVPLRSAPCTPYPLPGYHHPPPCMLYVAHRMSPCQSPVHQAPFGFNTWPI